MKYLKIFILLLAGYSISIPFAMYFVPENFKSALFIYLISAPFYGALMTYYFYWRNSKPIEPNDELA